ncbi:MAG: [LysW]-lysine hydrolase [Trueperaceae bacterium]|nr:[LysW]-lysine hydrolase [Trueperaceae bacterium]MCO5174449.1 [LysW]-lysine hydrolase [Trueperaceae bacterium]MCW5819844.1 [LysW]-lysine hydrolase [Trueperaceae bacterium]
MSEEQAVELVRRSVATASLSGGERPLAEYLVGAVAGSAASAFVDAAGNAVATWGRGPKLVTFLGHLDTVAGEVPVRVEGGVLHGRGSVDAKGSLCAALAAATRMPEAVWDRLAFTFIGAVEEEAPSSRGARHAVAAYPLPDLLIVGEPSGWERYTLGYKGRLGVTLTVRRANAHSAREDASAAELTADAYARLREWVGRDNEGVAGLFERLQLTLLSLASGEDGLEAWCVARASLRVPPRWTCARLRDAVAELLPTVALEFTEGLDAHRADGRTELARAFRVAVRAEGGSPVPSLKTGTSDMNVVAPHWPVPMLAYGPGDSNLDHTPEERLDLAEYLRAVRVFERALVELAGVG